jgi:phosphatidylglycerol:prolipoprotein diacylglycerol transferase
MIEIMPSREVFVSIGSWSLYWYGILYIFAFGVGWWLLPRLQTNRGLKLKAGDWLEILAWVATGVIVGGRLGYVMLYGWDYYQHNLAEVFYLGQGGMASHGGFIGVGVALWLVSRRQQIDFWRLADVVVVPAAIGLALGRMGNVINQEIFTTPMAQGAAIVKNLVIAGVCWWHLRRAQGRAGRTTALFLVMYGVLRMAIETWREQDFALIWGLTRGQWYTLPIIVVGVCLWWYFYQTDEKTKTTDP